VLVTGEPGIARRGAGGASRPCCTQRGALIEFQRVPTPRKGKLAIGPVSEWMRSDALAPRRGRLAVGHAGAELGRARSRS